MPPPPSREVVAGNAPPSSLPIAWASPKSHVQIREWYRPLTVHQLRGGGRRKVKLSDHQPITSEGDASHEGMTDLSADSASTDDGSIYSSHADAEERNGPGVSSEAPDEDPDEIGVEAAATTAEEEEEEGDEDEDESQAGNGEGSRVEMRAMAPRIREMMRRLSAASDGDGDSDMQDLDDDESEHVDEDGRPLNVRFLEHRGGTQASGSSLPCIPCRHESVAHCAHAAALPAMPSHPTLKPSALPPPPSTLEPPPSTLHPRPCTMTEFMIAGREGKAKTAA